MSSAVRRIDTADDMVGLGRRLAARLRAGDVVILDGPLGAGKTTLTRGLGEGLGVRGDVNSPTFVIARRHPPMGPGPALLHVDAYRVSGGELADLELDLEAADAVAVVEWGVGKADDWSADCLLVRIRREAADADGPRTVTLSGPDGRWPDWEDL